MTLDLKFFGVRTAWKASHGVTIYTWICDRVFESCFTKGAIHMTKKLMFAAMLTAALSAGALSVHQLRTGTHAIVACGSPCTSGDICKRPCGCFFGLGGTTGVCQPEGPAPAPPK
jgi:hypothetical protein